MNKEAWRETSMTDKHTPGPWKAFDSLMVGANGGRVADCENIMLPDEDEKRANARLIAAAPAMYGLLVELYDTTLDPDIIRILQPWFSKVETIIESIEGDA